MVRSRTPSQGGGSQGFEMERKYSVPSNPDSRVFSGGASEDLHAWSIYSSGYDSSDNETTTAQNYKHSRKYRSDPDFRMQATYHEQCTKMESEVRRE
ncbi:unnamed protein product [Callosobruchus maculatus]|uniref:Uncharacterized protein n=1 Tax=Callosobruchus maculatus TaxID=64391 RepID=A0A653BR21_CALMS|nr:unnamed protein product [Callosobruchus maculatus]